MGITAMVLQWFSSYLTGPQQYVKFGGNRFSTQWYMYEDSNNVIDGINGDLVVINI